MNDSWGCYCGASNPDPLNRSDTRCTEACVRSQVEHMRREYSLLTKEHPIPYYVLQQAVEVLTDELMDWQNDYHILKAEHEDLQNMYSTLLDKTNE